VDPLSALVAAVVVGATAALNETATMAVKDAYAALKALMRNKFAIDVAVIEGRPESASRQQVLREELQQAAAHQDAAVASLADALLAAVRRDCPDAVAAVGVRLDDIEGKALRVSRVDATGDGVKINRARIDGEIEISDVRAGAQRDPK
jgi:hypothetical protein